MFVITSCSTGIEGTRKITPTRDDRRLLRATPEENLTDSITVTPLGQWQQGRPFMIADDRAALIYEIYGPDNRRAAGDSLAGHIVEFRGTDTRTSPAGGSEFLVKFSDKTTGYNIIYPLRGNIAYIDSMTWKDFPMIIDMDITENIRHRLAGRKVWTRTPLWYDANGNTISGTRFTPVTIIDVLPGNEAFPLMIEFTDSDKHAYMPMNMPDGHGNRGSRNFGSLFALSDPKEQYPAILPEVWDLIRHGRVCEGMTKDECRLALGNPTDVDQGHNWNNLVDIWGYPDGTYLLFIDGRLSKTRRE